MKKYALDVAVTVKPEGSYSYSEMEVRVLNLGPLTPEALAVIPGSSTGPWVGAMLQDIVQDLLEKDYRERESGVPLADNRGGEGAD